MGKLVPNPAQATLDFFHTVPRVVRCGADAYPVQMESLPRFRYMGNKTRLLPWIHGVLRDLDFESAADVFCGSTAVSYLLKSMGKRTFSSDFLNFPAVLASAYVANSDACVGEQEIEILLSDDRRAPRFITETFEGIFFSREGLEFLDRVSWNLQKLESPAKRDLARAALIRSCMKRQPRGVFTVAGDPEHYKDARRDLQLSLREHFLEQLAVCNAAVFQNGQTCTAENVDVFEAPKGWDLVYMDPPYVPRSDDNCYIKRYHFLEGLSCYWKDREILETSRVKKLKKPFTPFSYRRTAIDAFDRLFRHFAESKLVLSYSSNAYPSLDALVELMKRYKQDVQVFTKPHRYHFGTHSAAKRNEVDEYLIVGV